MTSLRDLSPEKTEAILQGAMQEFLAHGYAGARIDKIVATAGVSKATLYRRFPDKEALFMALIKHLSAKKEPFQMQNQQIFEEEPTLFLKRYAAGMLENFANDPQVKPFLRMVIGESGRFPELARAATQTIEKPSYDFLVWYFANHPKLQVAEPDVMARIFLGALVHVGLIEHILHSGDILPMDHNRLVNGLLKTIRHAAL